MRPEWGVVLSGGEAQHLLKTCSRARPAGLSRGWTPGRPEIDRLEARLPVVLAHALARIIVLEPIDHPLAVHQREGIALEELLEIIGPRLHDGPGDG